MAYAPFTPIRSLAGRDVVLDPGDVPPGTGATWGRTFEEDLPYRFYDPANIQIENGYPLLEPRPTWLPENHPDYGSPTEKRSLPPVGQDYRQIASAGDDMVQGAGENNTLAGTGGGDTLSGKVWVNPVGGVQADKPIWDENAVPYAGGGRFTRSFSGDRGGGGSRHTGVDIPAPIGTPIYAIQGGVIRRSEKSSSGYGYTVDIEYPDGTVHRMAHLSGPSQYEVGTAVPEGTVIATTGISGNANRNFQHVHYEVINTPYYNAKGGLPPGREGSYSSLSGGRQDPRLYFAGWRGPDAAIRFQQAAQAAGYYTGKIDGIIGPQTETAVQAMAAAGALAGPGGTGTAVAAAPPAPVDPVTQKLAATMLTENRGGGDRGMMDVGNVALNRVRDTSGRWGNTLDEVLNPNHFAIKDLSSFTPEEQARALDIATKLQSGDITDTTGGATSFLTAGTTADWAGKPGFEFRATNAGLDFYGQGQFDETEVAAATPPPATTPAAPNAAAFAELPAETPASATTAAATRSLPFAPITEARTKDDALPFGRVNPPPPSPFPNRNVLEGITVGPDWVKDAPPIGRATAFSPIAGRDPLTGATTPYDLSGIRADSINGRDPLTGAGPAFAPVRPMPSYPLRSGDVMLNKEGKPIFNVGSIFNPSTGQTMLVRDRASGAHQQLTDDDLAFGLSRGWQIEHQAPLPQGREGDAYAKAYGDRKSTAVPAASRSPLPQGRDVYARRYGTEQREIDAGLKALNTPPASMANMGAAFAPVPKVGTHIEEAVKTPAGVIAPKIQSLTGPALATPATTAGWTNPVATNAAPEGPALATPATTENQPNVPVAPVTPVVPTVAPVVPAVAPATTPAKTPTAEKTATVDVSPKGGFFSKILGGNNALARSLAGIGGPQVFNAGGPSGTFPGGYKYQTGTGIQGERSTQFQTPGGRTYTYTDQSQWGQPSIGGWSK